MKHGFWYQYLRSARPYYCFVTGSATLLGVDMAHGSNDGTPWWHIALALIFGFCAWGVNQIFNDATKLKKDCVNAPERPMVSGTLDVRKAVLVSAVLMALLPLM